MRRAGAEGGGWSRSPWFWWVVGLIILIVAGMVLWIFFGSRRSPNPAVPTTGSERSSVASACVLRGLDDVIQSVRNCA